MATEITFSELDSYATCPWQWWQKYVKLRRRKKQSVKLSFGAAIHEGVEAMYNREDDPVGVAVKYAEGVKKKAEDSGIELGDDYILTLKKVEYVMKAYVNRYHDDFSKYNILSVEPEFRIPLDGMDVIVRGKIDRILTEKKTGLFFPVETKTAAAWNPDINRLMLDFQISVYAWAVSKLLSLKDVTFLYDVIKKPMQRIKKNESESEFLQRIFQAYEDDPDNYFIRDKVTRSRQEIERTEREITIRAKEVLRMRESGEIYRTPGEHCHWKCDFMPPCLEDTDDMWDAMYITMDRPHQELAAR
jgi:ATP-dependent helicase/DNAse subunit B